MRWRLAPGRPTDTAGLPPLGPFSQGRLDWQLQRDGMMLVAALGALVLLIAWAAGGGLVHPAAPVVAGLLVVGCWVGITLITARVLRQLPGLTVKIHGDPEAAAAELAELMERRPLHRWVRLALYHRMAALRHRQGRYAEAAAICRSVLGHGLGPGEAGRGHLLLMLAESSLACGDLFGAWAALSGMQQVRLSLSEALQRLVIQTRYELMIGADAQVLWALEQKVQLAELMPAEQGAVVHLMMAQGASRMGRGWEQTASWLWRRASLLATGRQLELMTAGRQVVGPVPDPVLGDGSGRGRG